ncbi:MFS transporter [Streptococcaceae bacterium ESL0687]|nr:MFS transporter [Streptococcaceae bacterium ESL0687]
MFTKNPKAVIPAGMLISNIGNGMYTLSIGILLYNHTGKTSSFALIVVLQAVLSFLTQSFASVVSDKGFAQVSAVLAEFLRGSLILIFGILSYFTSPNLLIILAALLSFFQPFYRTSVFVIAPLIASGSDLAKYNARVSAFQQIGQLVGAGVAGFIISFLSPYGAIFVNGLSYLVSAYTMHMVTIPTQDTKVFDFLKSLHHFKISMVLNDWKTLFNHLSLQKSLFFLAFFGVIDAVIANYINILYAPMLTYFNAQNYWLSIWDGLFAVGAIVGVEIFGRLNKFHENILLSMFALTMELACFLILSISSLQMVAPVMLILGLNNSLSSASFNLTLQTAARQEFLGKISGLRQMSISLSTVLIIPLLSSGLNKSFKLGNSYMAFVICFVICASFGCLKRYMKMGNKIC